MNLHTPITLPATWLDLGFALNTSQFRADCAVADAIAETRRLGREAMERARERIKERAQETSPGSETDSRRAHNAEISGATPEPAIQFHDRAAGTENGVKLAGAHREPANIKQGSPLSRCNSGLCRG